MKLRLSYLKSKFNAIIKIKIKKIYIFLLLAFFILFFSTAFFIHLLDTNREFREETKDFFCSKILKNNICQNLYNSYNVKFLPETQFANFELTKINLDNSFLYKKFFIEEKANQLVLVDSNGKIEFVEAKKILNNNTNAINTEEINSNLVNLIKPGQVLDILIHENHLYASYYSYSNISNCTLLNVAVASIETNNLNFNNLIKFDECQDSKTGGGRMKPYKLDNIEGLLLTTAQHDSMSKNLKAQDDNSIYGKILFIDLNTRSYEIFAKGVRNPQGLFVSDDLILTTEHGPRGGDEINKIEKNKNYGWPLSSYGEPYGEGFGDRNSNFLFKNYYKKNHSSYGYEEPIFAFVPSIGISEIIKVSNKFHPKWNNSYLVASLSGRSLYRIRFDQEYSRVLVTEQIFIGRRIRDLKYSKKLDSIILALEDFGELGILKPEKLQN